MAVKPERENSKGVLDTFGSSEPGLTNINYGFVPDRLLRQGSGVYT